MRALGVASAGVLVVRSFLPVFAEVRLPKRAELAHSSVAGRASGGAGGWAVPTDAAGRDQLRVAVRERPACAVDQPGAAPRGAAGRGAAPHGAAPTWGGGTGCGGTWSGASCGASDSPSRITTGRRSAPTPWRFARAGPPEPSSCAACCYTGAPCCLACVGLRRSRPTRAIGNAPSRRSPKLERAASAPTSRPPCAPTRRSARRILRPACGCGSSAR